MRNPTGTIRNAQGCTVGRNTERTGNAVVTDEPGSKGRGTLKPYSDVR